MLTRWRAREQSKMARTLGNVHLPTLAVEHVLTHALPTELFEMRTVCWCWLAATKNVYHQRLSKLQRSGLRMLWIGDGWFQRQWKTRSSTDEFIFHFARHDLLRNLQIVVPRILSSAWEAIMPSGGQYRFDSELTTQDQKNQDAIVRIFNHACDGGALDTVRWLLGNFEKELAGSRFQPICPSNIIYHACCSGNNDLVFFLDQKFKFSRDDIRWNSDSCLMLAIHQDNVVLVNYLFAKGQYERYDILSRQCVEYACMYDACDALRRLVVLSELPPQFVYRRHSKARNGLLCIKGTRILRYLCEECGMTRADFWDDPAVSAAFHENQWCPEPVAYLIKRFNLTRHDFPPQFTLTPVRARVWKTQLKPMLKENKRRLRAAAAGGAHVLDIPPA